VRAKAAQADTKVEPTKTELTHLWAETLKKCTLRNVDDDTATFASVDSKKQGPSRKKAGTASWKEKSKSQARFIRFDD
jgi:hypothetical protein